MKLITHTIKFGVYLLMGVFFVGITAFFVIPPAFGTGPFMIKIVQSGSMEPVIMTGSIVLIKTGAAYDIGDVVTFKSSGSDTPTTHRVVGYEDVEGKQYLVTKGDANEERDAELVSPNAVIGAVYFSVPRIGFILDFARRPIGFALLIGLPAALIILDELEKIYRTVRGIQTKTQTPTPQTVARTTPSVRRTIIVNTSARTRRTLEVLPYQNSFKQLPPKRSVDYIRQRPSFVGATTMVAFLVVIGMNTGGTISYLQNIETSIANEFISTEVDFAVSADTTVFTVVVDTVVPNQNQLTFTVFDSSPLIYSIGTSFMGGDSTFCAGINLISTDGVVHNGPLLSLNVASPFTLETPLNFLFAYDATTTVADGSVCLVDVVISGYDQASLQVPFVYHDIETISLTFVYDDETIVTPPTALLSTFVIEEAVSDVVITESEPPLNFETETTIQESEQESEVKEEIPGELTEKPPQATDPEVIVIESEEINNEAVEGQ